MTSTLGLVAWVVLGAGLAVPYLLVGLRQTGRAARVWWAAGLVAVALVYVALAAARGAPPLAVAFELGGVVVYGVFAWLGLRGSLGWLSAGWLLHSVWDVGLHTGFALAPAWYVWACLGFDVVVGLTLYGRAVRR